MYKLLSALLKNLGFGLTFTGIQDQTFENGDFDDANSIYNFCAMTLGACMWIGGCYLEMKNHARGEYPRINRSTHVIQQCLSHACGLGLVNSITHFAKNVDTTSAKIAVLNTALFGPVAIQEMNKASVLPTTIPWEKSRLLVLIVSDYALSAGMKRLTNDEGVNPLAIAAMCIGFFVATAECAYGLQKDRGMSMQSYLNRRFFKIIAGVNLIFTLLDIIHLDNDKYIIADNVFLTTCSLLLFATLLELRSISIALKARQEQAYQRLMAEFTANRPSLFSASQNQLPVVAPRDDYLQNSYQLMPETELDIRSESPKP